MSSILPYSHTHKYISLSLFFFPFLRLDRCYFLFSLLVNFASTTVIEFYFPVHLFCFCICLCKLVNFASTTMIEFCFLFRSLCFLMCIMGIIIDLVKLKFNMQEDLDGPMTRARAKQLQRALTNQIGMIEVVSELKIKNQFEIGSRVLICLQLELGDGKSP